MSLFIQFIYKLEDLTFLDSIFNTYFKQAYILFI